MAANELTYAEINPAGLLRDVMFDLLPEDAKRGYAYPAIFGTPYLMEAGSVARGRAVDMSAAGPVHGSLFVKNKRNILGAAYTDAGVTKLVGQTIGAARRQLDAWAPTQVAFTMQQYDGKATVPIHHLDKGFLPRGDEEIELVQNSMSSIHYQLEEMSAAFFCGVAADGNPLSPGWTEVDWQAGATGGTALSASDDFMQVFHSVITAARIRGAGAINTMICSQRILDKLAIESSILGRTYVRNGGAADPAGEPNLRVGGFSSLQVQPPLAIIEILKQHLGFENVYVSAADRQSNVGMNSVFPDDRIWIGSAGETSIALGRGGAPRVVSGAGSYVKLIGKADTATGPVGDGPMPQDYAAVSEVFCAPVCLDPAGGTVIHNMG